jgi:hypothetical protein
MELFTVKPLIYNIKCKCNTTLSLIEEENNLVIKRMLALTRMIKSCLSEISEQVKIRDEANSEIANIQSRMSILNTEIHSLKSTSI